MSKTAVVVGAGPVGCLAAIALAKRGWVVNIYEARTDLRLPSSKAETRQRSINLAISHRGITAVRAIDPEVAHRFLQHVIPMRGRMIHSEDGGMESQQYDRHGQCINSIDRALLNEKLLDEASTFKNVNVFFKHKVLSADFDKKSVTIRDIVGDKELTTNFDFCIGADGSHSVTRRQLMRVVRMDYQQEYIKHEYVELKIPAGSDGGKPTFLLDPTHLHIWPRHSFMLIALPNQDYTFTCTLFAPSSELDTLTETGRILSWFKTYFPDAVNLIGEKRLLEDFTQNPRCPLICTKCKPYHYKDAVILLGDAAHSMVPFYGQGLNSGLEDVRVLTSLIDGEGVGSTSVGQTDPKLARALQTYTDSRHEDLIAICDLAMDNYVEMRHSVTTTSYHLRKFVDDIFYGFTSRKAALLDELVPVLSRQAYPSRQSKSWIPLYTMVTFRPDISYANAKRRAKQQTKLLGAFSWTGILLSSSVVALIVKIMSLN